MVIANYGAKAVKNEESAAKRNSAMLFERQKKMGSDDSTLISDPLYDDWYQFDPNVDPELPPDFAERLGIHIMVLMEKHTSQDAMNIISELLNRHIINPKMYVLLFKVLRLFTAKPDFKDFLSVSWQALLNGKKKDWKSSILLDDIIKWITRDFLNNKARNFYSDQADPSITFSFAAIEFGDNFISLNEGTIRNNDLIRDVFSKIVATSLETVDINKEISDRSSIIINNQHEQTKSLPFNQRYIFNDIIFYIEYRSTNAGQEDYKNIGINHSRDQIKMLVRNLSAYRGQTIQSKLAQKLAKREEEIRVKLHNRSLTDEEIVVSTPIFLELLKYYYLEKRISTDLRGIEIVRSFAKIIGIFLGFSVVLASFIDPGLFSLYESFAIFIVMTIYSQFAYSQKFFQPLYPYRYSKQLNVLLGQYFSYFQKMSKEQLLLFNEKQIHNKLNKDYFFLIPELLLQLHNQFPPGKQKQATKADVFETVIQLQGIVDEMF